MKIYLIEKRDIVEPYLKKLERYGEVVVLDSGESDINKYKQLFEDDSDKVLGVNTGMLEWKLPNSALGKMKNLKGVCSKSTWVGYLDLKFCKKNNITVCNLPGYNAQSVAEYAIWMMLSLAKNLPMQLDSKFKVVISEENKQTEIDGKTMGIVGLGYIGKRIAKIGKGLGMNVIYWSRETRDKRFEYNSLDSVLKNSDFLFNCVQTLEGTAGLLNKKRLSTLKNSAYVISVIGGMGYSSQDDNYLVKMINEGKLAGFAVENEHEPSFKLPTIKKGKNVFIPANYAFFTKEAQERGVMMWIESIIGIASGKYVNVVN